MISKRQKERRKNFFDLVKINVFNTLILGGTIVLLTSYLNNKTEKSKSKDSFLSEFNKIKAQKIGESWEELNVLEWEVNIACKLQETNLKNANYSIPYKKEDSPLISDLVKRSNDYTILLRFQKNRFWMGENQYELMMKYASLIARKVGFLSNFNQDSINKIDQIINQNRLELDSVTVEMINY